MPRSGAGQAARYRAIFGSATDFAIVATDCDGRVTDWNTGAERVLGWTAAEMLGTSADRIFTPEDQAADVPRIEMCRALEAGRASDERWHVHADDTRFWASGEMMPLRDDDGAHLGFLKILRDRTPQHVAGEALRLSEARWRAIFENMHEGFALCEIVYDADGVAEDFRYLELNSAWERLTGIPADRTIGLLASEAIPGIEPFWTDTYARVVETGEPARFEYRIASIGRWFEVFAYRTGPGRFAALFLNVTGRKAAEARQALLAQEVDHRAKNALAVVLAALRLTKAPDVPSFRQAIEGRVAALARAQTALADDRWTGADLRALLEGELAPFLGAEGRSGPWAALEGPGVLLPAGMTQPLAMAMHELATNATKYGALSVPSGRVAVAWRTESDVGAAPRLLLRWAETGGPSIARPPERRGFGTRVLDGTVRGQLGGTVSLAWEPAGLVCELDVPLRPGPVAADGVVTI